MAQDGESRGSWLAQQGLAQGSLSRVRSLLEETEIAPADGAGAGPLQPPTEQTLGSLLGFLVRLRDDHSPWWSPREPLAEDLAATFEALGLREADLIDQILTVERTLTADNTDFLAGTILDQPGTGGSYTVWGASTVGDTEITVSLGGRRLVDAGILVLRANSEIRENEDTFYQMVSQTGGRPVININVVTAATVRIRVKFLPAFPT